MLPPKLFNNLKIGQIWFKNKNPNHCSGHNEKTPTISNQENQTCFLTSTLGCPKPNQYIPFRSHNYESVANHLNSKWNIQTTKKCVLWLMSPFRWFTHPETRWIKHLFWVLQILWCSLPVEKKPPEPELVFKVLMSCQSSTNPNRCPWRATEPWKNGNV